jgi:hypothetical protein
VGGGMQVHVPLPATADEFDVLCADARLQCMQVCGAGR